MLVCYELSRCVSVELLSFVYIVCLNLLIICSDSCDRFCCFIDQLYRQLFHLRPTNTALKMGL